MLELIFYYLIGSLVVCGVQTFWFCSDLPIHLCKLLRLIHEDDDVYTWEEWQIWAVSRSNFFGSLLSCTVCMSFWVSLAAALTQHLYLTIGNPWYVVIAVTGWPVIAYTFYKLIK